MKPVFRKEEAFYFFTGVGDFAGKLALSLAAFHDKLEIINVEPVNSHFSRQDLEKWIKETLGDDQLQSKSAESKG